jgi:hypothetical protein
MPNPGNAALNGWLRRKLTIGLAHQASCHLLHPRSGRALLKMEESTPRMGATVNLAIESRRVSSFTHEFLEYGLPVDEDELDRLDMNHQKYTLLQENKLFLAPITPTPHRILDLGTGTGTVPKRFSTRVAYPLKGIFAIDIADMYPSATVSEASGRRFDEERC